MAKQVRVLDDGIRAVISVCIPNNGECNGLSCNIIAAEDPRAVGKSASVRAFGINKVLDIAGDRNEIIVRVILTNNVFFPKKDSNEYFAMTVDTEATAEDIKSLEPVKRKPALNQITTAPKPVLESQTASLITNIIEDLAEPNKEAKESLQNEVKASVDLFDAGSVQRAQKEVSDRLIEMRRTNCQAVDAVLVEKMVELLVVNAEDICLALMEKGIEIESQEAFISAIETVRSVNRSALTGIDGAIATLKEVRGGGTGGSAVESAEKKSLGLEPHIGSNLQLVHAEGTASTSVGEIPGAEALKALLERKTEEEPTVVDVGAATPLAIAPSKTGGNGRKRVRKEKE